MKTKQQIEDEIAVLWERRKTSLGLQREITNMNSETGIGSRRIISNIEGKITALKWVLK